MVTDVNGFHMAFYVAAFLVSLTIFIYTFIQKRTDKDQNVAFILMLFIIIVNSLSEVVIETLIPRASDSGGIVTAEKVLSFFYFVSHIAMPPLFLYYECCVTGVIKRLTDLRAIVALVPLFVTELMLVLNLSLRFVYYYDENGKFQRTWGMGVIYAVSISYLLCALFHLLINWKAITMKKKLALIYFFSVVILGVIIQLIFKEIRTELFAEAIAFIGVMLTIETEDNRIDLETGVYNRRALHMDLENIWAFKSSIDLICIKITDMDAVLKGSGTNRTKKLMNDISEFLKTVIQRFYIYNVDTGQFVIVISRDEGDDKRKLIKKILAKYEPECTTDEIIQKIQDRFSEPWNVGRVQATLNSVILKAKCPEELKTVDDVFYLLNSPVPKKIEKKLLEGKDLDYILRRTAVEQAILRAIDTNEFEVYYQPTYYLTGFKLHGAEALLRLHDSELGNVFPDEFIPVVEQMGLIDDVDDFVLKQVCEFIKTGIPEKAGMDCINVNLSVSQCMRDGFVERMNSIVESYDIPKSMINFEITESVAADDYDKLRKVIDELKTAGFKFSMDDYGTGYSNVQSSFSLDYDSIKIDKSILWGAEKSQKGKTILTNSVNMIKQMDKEIVVEGVETDAQIDMLKELPVDYLQGYYFSKPIPRDELIKKIRGES
ncbi:MAG: EAL domain-containing protein [Eubacterium sp.]|nr:EAL domain-containing protein [Eubacterium sp.]